MVHCFKSDLHRENLYDILGVDMAGAGFFIMVYHCFKCKWRLPISVCLLNCIIGLMANRIMEKYLIQLRFQQRVLFDGVGGNGLNKKLC